MKTWILIADGSRATLYSRSSQQPKLHPMENWDNQAGRIPDHLSETDRLGTSRGVSGRHGSSMTPVTDPKRHSQQLFAKELADILKQRLSGYDHLVVVASPKVLGDLRHAFDEKVQQKIVGEFDKDLTGVSAHDLPQHLDKLMGTPQI